MPSNRDTLTFKIFQTAVYDTVKGFTWFLFGIGATLVAPQLQELTGTSWLGSMGWILLGWVLLSFAFVLVYGVWFKPSAVALADGQLRTPRIFVWRVNISKGDFTSDRPYVDVDFSLFNGSLNTVEVKAQDAGGYVKFSKPLGRRLELLADEVVDSLHHGRLRGRQWLSREDVQRQVKWLTSPTGMNFGETFNFPGLPRGPSFVFDFGELRIPVVATDGEYPLLFDEYFASYYLSEPSLEKIRQATTQETDES